MKRFGARVSGGFLRRSIWVAAGFSLRGIFAHPKGYGYHFKPWGSLVAAGFSLRKHYVNPICGACQLS